MARFLKPSHDVTTSADESGRVEAALRRRMGEQAPEPRLDATRRALELLGDLHRGSPVIHITGTNGKTSTARMIDSILRAAGKRTGLMTSPHLVRLSERVCIGGEPIDDALFGSTWDAIQPTLDTVDAELVGEGRQPLTFFEAFTVLTFACFAAAKVDPVILEVGMGGEWDCTNVADGDVAVITPIALDHMQFLGPTLEAIARNKAGIIKPGSAVVSSEQQQDARRQIEEAAARNGSTLVFDGDAFAVKAVAPAAGGHMLTLSGTAAEYHEIHIPLLGEYQAHNAALAVAAVELFMKRSGETLAPDAVLAGLAGATSPGRLQIIATHPAVLVDAAHNPHGARSLAGVLAERWGRDPVVAVVGVLADKDATGIIRNLAGSVQHFVVTQSNSPRATPADTLTATVVDVVGKDRVTVAADLKIALLAARDLVTTQVESADVDGLIVVAGSITLVGEALDLAAGSDGLWSDIPLGR